MSNRYMSSSPHIRGNSSIQGIMRDVLISLVPVVAASCFIFGTIRVLTIIAISVITCVLSEYICCLCLKRPNSTKDLSAIVTGMLFACVIPPTIPIYAVIIGAVFAIVLAKQLFGGLGSNFINPALAARAFLTLSYPSAMTNYTPTGFISTIDTVTSATPLSAPQGQYNMLDAFLGYIPGSIGETAKWAILIALAYLLLRRVISIRVPLIYILTTMAVLYLCGEDGLYGIMIGGVLFGAVFMATDYVTSPITPLGQMIFAIGCGVITAVIRVFAGAPEGTMFSILVMNCVTPLIDKLIRPKAFGEIK